MAQNKIYGLHQNENCNLLHFYSRKTLSSINRKVRILKQLKEFDTLESVSKTTGRYTVVQENEYRTYRKFRETWTNKSAAERVLLRKEVRTDCAQN